MADIRETKISLGTFITVGSVVAGGLYISSLYSLARKAQVQVSARVHKVDFRGITIVISTRVLNPTNGTVQVRHPYVSLFASPKMKDSRVPFAHSAISNQTHTIIPDGETVLPDINLFIPTSQILLISADLLVDGKIELIANVRTKVITKWLISKTVDTDISLKLDINQLRQVLSQSKQQEIIRTSSDSMLDALMMPLAFSTPN